MKNILLTISCLLLPYMLQAQTYSLGGKVVGTDRQAIVGAVISVSEDIPSVLTDEEGAFKMELTADKVTIKVSKDGYFPVEMNVAATEKNLQVVLVSEQAPKFSEVQTTASVIVRKKDLQTAFSIEQAIQGEAAGLQVIGKGGMPGEGAYLNIRGLHSLNAENTPLIVINGIPYMGDNSMSSVIGGYSRSLLSAYNLADIKSVTVLKGAGAAIYGSLGSNGVLLVETEQAQSDNTDTRISFYGQYGMNFKNRSLPLLDGRQYAEYMRNIGMTRYGSMKSLYTDYPFLQSGTDYYHHYIFNNNTDWQSEIYAPAFSTNNVFRVEGGDEIAKYNLSVGYSNDGGVVRNTNTNRFNTLLNASILVNRKTDIFTTVGLSSTRSRLQEQGMYEETNPLLAACLSNPLLNPFAADDNGRLTDNYATYHFSNVNDNPEFAYENTSNAAAIVNSVEATDKLYDVNVRLGLNYRPDNFLTFTGVYNIYYRYLEENIFIPGVTEKTILPQYYGIGENTVRKAISTGKNIHLGLNAAYKRVFNDVHALNAQAGLRYIKYDLEYDMASGYNTANDFYQTLDKTEDEEHIQGYNREWIWQNNYLHVDYTYNNLLKASVNLAIDGSSVSGVDAPRYYVYPSAGLTFMAAELTEMPAFIDVLNLRAEYALSGNSRFSSNYAKNYYCNSNYFMMGTITRSNVPNTYLEPEKNRQLDLGLDMSLLGRRFDISLGHFDALAYDLLIAKNISAAYGSKAYYDNAASIASQGFEASARFNIIETRNFGLTVGGNITSVKSKVVDLGDRDRLVLKYNEDDVQVVLEVGEEPYQFYGYQTNGVYATTTDANASGLTNINSGRYQGGDVIFVDNKKDGVINEADKVYLGSAAPDFYGSLYAGLRFQNLSLMANFRYSVGNMAYNALRRRLESMGDFSNQSTAVVNRWRMEGQVTEMPRAVYGDPAGNNVFSDRWMEDASYLKLGSLTLNYHFNKAILNFIQGGDIWLSGENQLTFSNYLGSDPEFAYSYDESMQGFDYGKIALPRSVRIGFNLNFFK